VVGRKVHLLEDAVGCKSDQLGTVGCMNMVSAKPKCKMSGCTKSSVIALGGRDLCLDHFLSNCYEQLDTLEPMVRRRSLELAEALAAGAFLDECSNCTLVISLHHEHLCNMDRSRLLNILLMAGELRLLLRKPFLKLADPVSDLSAVFFGKTPAKSKIAEDQEGS